MFGYFSINFRCSQCSWLDFKCCIYLIECLSEMHLVLCTCLWINGMARDFGPFKLIFCTISFTFFNCKRSSARHSELSGLFLYIYWLKKRSQFVKELFPFLRSYLPLFCLCIFTIHIRITLNPLNICSSGTKNSCKFWEYWYRIIKSCRQLSMYNTSKKNQDWKLWDPIQTDWIISKAFSSFKILCFFYPLWFYFLKSLLCAQHYTKLTLEGTGKGRDTKEAS